MAAAPTERQSGPAAVDHRFRPAPPGRLLTGTAMGGGLTSRSRLLLALHRAVLRTSESPLKQIWALLYRAAARGVCAYVARGEREAAIYLRGSVGTGDFVPWLSDVDTAVVFADGPGAAAACARARRRWAQLRRLLPAVALLVDGPLVYRQSELGELAGVSALTYRLHHLGSGRDRAAYFGPEASFDRLRQLERPGLYSVSGGWALLRGPDRRPTEARREAGEQRISAWLELVYLWRLAYPLLVQPPGPRASRLCVKLICEPARIWLWLCHGERAAGQEDVLARALRRMPEEEEALRLARELGRSLSRSPAPPLDSVLPPLVRISSRIASRIEADLGADTVQVALRGSTAEMIEPRHGERGSGGRSGRLPLADWRALACPLVPDESLRPLEGSPADLATVTAVTRAGGSGPYPALRAGEVMLLPAAPWWRTRLRAIKSRASDPVSFALAEGARTARFPTAAGWSVRDAAHRAVAEHRAWLLGAGGEWSVRESSLGPGGTLALLLTAARAALLLESVEREEPELCLTVTEAARALAGRLPHGLAPAEEAIGEYCEFRRSGRRPSGKTVSALGSLVRALPAYRA